MSEPFKKLSLANARVRELEDRIAEMKARIAYLTVDCDEYVFKGGRCYQYEADTICPREPRCHDKDRWTARAEAGSRDE